jgi:hypothetical protein
MAGLIAVTLRNKRAKEQAKADQLESDGEEDRLSLPSNYYRQPKYVRPPGQEVIRV